MLNKNPEHISSDYLICFSNSTQEHSNYSSEISASLYIHPLWRNLSLTGKVLSQKKKRVSSSPTHHYTGRGSTASTPGAITGISCCTEPVGPQRSSEEHNFPPSLWSRSCLGYLHLLIPLTSKEAQGWCRLRHQPSSEISCSSRSWIRSLLRSKPDSLPASMEWMVFLCGNKPVWSTHLSVQKKQGKG